MELSDLQPKEKEGRKKNKITENLKYKLFKRKKRKFEEHTQKLQKLFEQLKKTGKKKKKNTGSKF